eukprot:g23119.t1
MLVDFGLAAEVGKVLEEGEDEGTPIYLAPEARCGPVSCDGSLDMFSLGVALFAMLSGRLPTHRASPALSSERANIRGLSVVAVAYEVLTLPQLNWPTDIRSPAVGR